LDETAIESVGEAKKSDNSKPSTDEIKAALVHAESVERSNSVKVDEDGDDSSVELCALRRIRSGIPLTQIQCELDKQGASNLVVELIVKNPNQTIFLKSVELGIALLEGGNTVIQKSIFSKLKNGNHSERFFSVFYQKMKQAEAEIKNMVTVNTSDLIKNNRSGTGDDGSGSVTPRYRNSFMARSNSFSSLNGAGAQPPPLLTSEELQQAYQAKICPTNISNRLKSTILNNTVSPYLVVPSLAADEQALVNAFDRFASYSSYDPSPSSNELKLPEEIVIMRPILRFLQLLCENHNRELQNYLRNQNNKNNYNLISEALIFLDCICGSTTGALGLLGLYINESNVDLVNQTLETLTEYCQGPCHENQNCIAKHESNGIDNIIALILNDIQPLSSERMDLVLELKNNASKLLLAIMESRADSENAQRILMSMSPRQLIEVASNAFHQQSDVGNVCAKEVGHNIYILCHQLAEHNKELANYLKSYNLHDSTRQAATVASATSSPASTSSCSIGSSSSPMSSSSSSSSSSASGSTRSNETERKLRQSLPYYASHTAQIEIVRNDRSMERIVFPVPPVCEYLTKESKSRLFLSIERDEQGSKVSDFFNATDDLYAEMKWQKQLREQPTLYRISRQMSTWSSLSFNLAVLINLIVAFLYPFNQINNPLRGDIPFWLFASNCLLIGIVSLLFPFLKSLAVRLLIGICIFRLIPIFGVEPILLLLGITNMLVAGVHMLSILGNRGLFTKRFDQILTDFHFLYQSAYLLLCVFGLLVHPLFYSILLFNMVHQEETLKNVIRSVTRNGRSILLTALLALILIYSFSIIGFLFFRDDFLVETEPNLPTPSSVDSIVSDLASKSTCSFASESELHCSVQDVDTSNDSAEESEEVKERACDSLIMCIITTLNQGLRNGGGIGDVLRPPSSAEPLFIFRVIYDLLFYFILIVITLNLIFGVIIDTFADLRSEKQQKDEIIRNTCFICGLERGAFDNRPVSFDEHVKSEHNLWHYLYFIVLIKVKNRTEFTGPESYVCEMIESRNLEWFPRMRAMSLISAEETDSEQNEIRMLSEKLDLNTRLVGALTQQLQELKEQASQS
jgi:inositol 1,4,5-triphosphate receptor type 1